MAVHVYHPFRQPDATNFCKPLNGHCSHICVPAPQLTSNSAKTSCICPNGYKLEKDNLNCVTDRKYSYFKIYISLNFVEIFRQFASNAIKIIFRFLSNTKISFTISIVRYCMNYYYFFS